MDKEELLIKSLISPPGDTLKEHLEFIEMAPEELAKKMNVPIERIDGVICGKEVLTAELARKLEDALEIPVTFWIKREKEYRQ